MRISDWSSDVCSSDLIPAAFEVEASLAEMDAVGKNRGKPDIWSNWDDFTEKAKSLEDKSAALASAFQSGDSGAIQTALGDMGKNGCGGCHDDFRGPKVDSVRPRSQAFNVRPARPRSGRAV